MEQKSHDVLIKNADAFLAKIANQDSKFEISERSITDLQYQVSQLMKTVESILAEARGNS